VVTTTVALAKRPFEKEVGILDIMAGPYIGFLFEALN
jgi:hypothetical protein